MKCVHQKGDPDPRSILIVLPTWVGDFVMATPALRAIRSRFTDAHITFLAEPNLHDLIRGGDWMNECVAWPMKSHRSIFYKPYRDLVWDLRRRRFDWAVMLPNSFRSALIARMAGAKRRIGYDRDGRGFLLTDRLPVKNLRKDCSGKQLLNSNHTSLHETHGQTSLTVPPDTQQTETLHGQTSLPMPPSAQQNEIITVIGIPKNLPVKPGKYVPMPIVDYYADLCEAIGCERPDDQLELFTTSDCDKSLEKRLTTLGIAHHRPLIVISPGAKYGASKCWLPDRFAAVADRLIEIEKATVIVTCGPGEESITQAIGQEMKQQGHIFDHPLLSLGELKSLIKRSDLLICNDTGPRHLAKAFGVPVVTVFGPTHPAWTVTSYQQERIVRIDVDCGPCQQRTCPLEHLDCMTGVTVDMVFAEAKELLQTRVDASVR